MPSFGFFERDDSKGVCDRNQWLNQINHQQITGYNLNVPHFESGLFHLGTSYKRSKIVNPKFTRTFPDDL